MNRVCLTKSGKLIEMQSGGYETEKLRDERLKTLEQNAINNGYKESDIETKWVTDDEWVIITEAQKDPKEENNKIIYAKLADLDLKSIRGIREWIAAQPTASQYNKNMDVEANAERAKIQK